MLTKGFSSCTQTRFHKEHLHCRYEIHHQLNQWDSGCDYWYWSGIGQLGDMHAPLPPPPVVSKRLSFKRVCLQKEVSACLWRIHNLASSCSADEVKWGLRRCSSEQKWSLLHVSPSASRSISRDIASKGSTDPNIRTPSGCRPMEDFVQGLHWQNQI